MSHSVEFLKYVLGPDGQKALDRANERSGGLGVVLGPRAIISWLSTAVRSEYEGEIPGLPNSYLSLHKNEGGFTGALTIQEQVYSFTDAPVLHVAASIAVALGMDDLEIPEHIKGTDISRLGKSIDMLVKARTIVKAMSEDISKVVLDPSLGYTFSHEHHDLGGGEMLTHVRVHAPDGTEAGGALFTHKGPNLEAEGVKVHPAHQRKGVASAIYAHAQKLTGKTIMPSHDQTPAGQALWAGNKANPQFGKGEEHAMFAKPKEPKEPEAPTAKAPSTAKTGPTVKPPMSKALTEVFVKKSDAERSCKECGGKSFKNDKFVGCMCFSALAKSVYTKPANEGYVLTMSRVTIDDDTIQALLKALVR